MSNFNKQLKEIVSDFMDTEGKILDSPKGKIIKKELSDERIEFLKQFIDLLLNTDFVGEEYKVYISDRFITLKGVYERLKYEALNKGEDESRVNFNNVKGKIWYDKNKITSIFSERVLIDIVEYDGSIEVYIEQLNSLKIKYNQVNLLNNLVLDIDTTLNTNIQIKNDISDEEFKEFINIIAPYSIKHVKYISDNLPKDTLEYVKKILSTSIINGKDLERKEILLTLLG